MGVQEMLLKSGVYAVVGGVIPGILANIPSQAMVRVNALGGSRVPSWLLGSISAVSASLLTDLAQSYIKPNIDNKNTFLDNETLVMSTIIGGATLPLLFYLANRNILGEYGFLNLALAGGSAEILGSFINSYWFG